MSRKPSPLERDFAAQRQAAAARALLLSERANLTGSTADRAAADAALVAFAAYL